ncbi:tetratricopeptide repeat protein [Acetobacter lambici]|uniref:Sel1 repeat family protein n=1 Tax=Acetobacter lambici TaxID=1332824 RepID=A0ABT1F3S8_9PROT|nr:tetratricopeptide repeat protein [Acetobacter lambici]MCP1243756.1 sel1 repeat family protein [Acetobacter lambici]MCP1259845.1 sel1 repeat family protein [Acetobacter lambici]
MPPSPVEGQLVLAQIYLDRGQMHAAFSMIEVAARSGHAQALNMLGRAYERGWGVTPNPLVAIQYFEMAARQNYGWAFFNLADLYMSGHGPPRDVGRAYGLYVRAAQAGVAKALNMIGLLHEDKSPKGLFVAREYYRAAAEAGDCWGALNMARLALQDGNISMAQEFFQKTLETGFDACFLDMKKLLAFMPAPYGAELIARTDQRLRKQS